jgi:hypothetical protein
MGDRVSVSFKKGDEESVVLFSHWGGKTLVAVAKGYVRELNTEAQQAGMTWPLYRLEPQTVMVDFIRMLTEGVSRVQSDYCLCRSPQDGDNSDNGHFVVDLQTGEATRVDEGGPRCTN